MMSKLNIGILLMLIGFATLAINGFVRTMDQIEAINGAEQLAVIREKQTALTNFELQCERARKPYCQEVIVIMKRELNVEYPIQS